MWLLYSKNLIIPESFPALKNNKPPNKPIQLLMYVLRGDLEAYLNLAVTAIRSGP